MIVTKNFIDSISHIETYSRKNFFVGRHSIIKIHFKQWYKPPQKIRYDWICISINGDTFAFDEPEQYGKDVNLLKEAIKCQQNN